LFFTRLKSLQGEVTTQRQKEFLFATVSTNNTSPNAADNAPPTQATATFYLTNAGMTIHSNANAAILMSEQTVTL
jgi:hypothetical protein